MSEHKARAELAEEMTEYGTVTEINRSRVSVITIDDIDDVLEQGQEHGAICVGVNELSIGHNVVLEVDAPGRSRPGCMHCAPALPCAVHVRGSGR